MGDLTKTYASAKEMIDEAANEIKGAPFLEIVGKENKFGGAYELLYFITKFIDPNRKEELSALLDELYRIEEKAFSESTAYYYVKYAVSQL